MSKHPHTVWEFEAIGTVWQIDTARALSQTQKDHITEFILAYERVFSRFVAGSLVDRIHRSAGTYPFPSYADELFALYNKLYELTGGVFTPLVGQILDDLGYDALYQLKPKQIAQAPKRWPDVATYANHSLHTTTPVLLDVGAAGKGHLVDLVGARIEGYGISEYVVDAGSDMRIRKPSSPLRIGLEHPQDTQKVIGVIEMSDKSLCGSSINRRRWGDALHHIIDPQSAAPSTGIVATWVIADSTMVADALATALFLVEPTVLLSEYRFEYVRINEHLQIDATGPFRAALF